MLSTTSLRSLRGFLIAGALLFAIWTAMWFFVLINRIALVWNEDDYRRGTLVVESTTIERFSHGAGPDRREERIWWALGTVRIGPDGGVDASAPSPTDHPGERMSLTQIVEAPDDLAALAVRVPPGTTFDVWFHPDMPKVLSQGEWLRVVPFDDEFFDDARRMRNGIARMTVLPLALTLAGVGGLTAVLRRRARGSDGAGEKAAEADGGNDG